jgi:uncharacterized protein (TIGR02145 family)
MKTNHFLSLAATLCISLLFSCAPEIEPIPELEYSSSSGTSSSSSRVSSSSVVIPGSSSSVKPSSGTYCLDYDWQECTLSNGNPCPNWSTPSDSCPSGWDIYNSSSNSKPSSSSVKPSSSSAVVSSSSVVVPSSSSSLIPSSSSIEPSSSSIVVPSSSSVVTGTGLCTGFVNGTKREHYGKEKEQFCDERDGKKYVYVTIGAQTWMAENLNYEAENSFCLDDDPANCEKYGRQYSWAIAMALPISCNNNSCSSSISANYKGICPSGWHIPSNEESDKLMLYVMSSSSLSSYNTTASKYLKTTSGWNKNCTDLGNNGTDDYGFSFLPFEGVPKDCTSYPLPSWWRINEFSNMAFGRLMYYGNGGLYYDYKRYLWSVRCLKD